MAAGADSGVPPFLKNWNCRVNKVKKFEKTKWKLLLSRQLLTCLFFSEMEAESSYDYRDSVDVEEHVSRQMDRDLASSFSGPLFYYGSGMIRKYMNGELKCPFPPLANRSSLAMANGTWNLRGRVTPGKLANVIQEMERTKMKILGLSETHWRDVGEHNASIPTEPNQYHIM